MKTCLTCPFLEEVSTPIITGEYYGSFETHYYCLHETIISPENSKRYIGDMMLSIPIWCPKNNEHICPIEIS
jgi:hypothetical protein